MKARTPPIDPGLQAIADLEANIILAHEQKSWSGVSAAEIERGRPAVVALARAVCSRLREEYIARSRQS